MPNFIVISTSASVGLVLTCIGCWTLWVADTHASTSLSQLIMAADLLVVQFAAFCPVIPWSSATGVVLKLLAKLARLCVEADGVDFIHSSIVWQSCPVVNVMSTVCRLSSSS